MRIRFVLTWAIVMAAPAALAQGVFNPPGGEVVEQAAPPPSSVEAPPVPAEDPAKAAARIEAEKYAQQAHEAYLKKLELARRESDAEIEACKNKYLEGKLKTHVQLVNCYNSKVTAYFRATGYPYYDLLRDLQAKRLEVARLIDKKIYTEAQGEAELGAFEKLMGAEEKRRDAEAASKRTRRDR